MMNRKTVRVVSEPPKQPHCSECLKTLQWLRNCADVYECSRIECPQRRPLTAAPGGRPHGSEGRGA